MLYFSPDFFKEEERDGFLIDSTMKTVWAAELEVLAFVADVCERYQLPWFAYAGTLLGAVRHGGFIPWDDDIDICMQREPYQKLMEVLPGELPEGWYVSNAICGREQTEFWGYVANADSISIAPERLQRFHGCPFMVSIDIFPLDPLPDNTVKAERERALFNLIHKAVNLAKLQEPGKRDREQLREALNGLEGLFNIRFDRRESLVSQLWALANQLCLSYYEAEARYISNFHANSRSPDFMFEREWFAYAEYLPFEFVDIPVPCGYREVVKREFGENYMTPVRNVQSHDYPFYNKQIEYLRNMVKEKERDQGCC
ncbi:MAG: LicD family protein [Butyrivibrio sp.]|nr:LicD family protein [Muribaculum sp.]MCM1551366.1 LicD family protein [Butyrivibrio sp.]